MTACKSYAILHHWHRTKINIPFLLHVCNISSQPAIKSSHLFISFMVEGHVVEFALAKLFDGVFVLHQ